MMIGNIVSIFVKKLIFYLKMIYDLINTPIVPINNFDPSAYTGIWVEYMRKKVSFQNDFRAQAEYTIDPKDPSGIIVKNTQPDGRGDNESIVGNAQLATEWNTDGNQKGTLWVRFPGANVAAPYWIVFAIKTNIIIDDKPVSIYKLSVVSDPFKKTLWILVRKGYTLSPSEYRELMEFLGKFNGWNVFENENIIQCV